MAFEVFYNDHYVVPLPETHPFPMKKYSLLRDHLLSDSIIAPEQLHVPDLATRSQLQLVHAGHYIQSVFDGTLSQAQERRLGFPWSEALVLRSRASVGGTIQALRSAVKFGISGSLAGGTHHAHIDFGSGFCVFNDMAVAIRDAQAHGLVEKAVMIDLDVHQGDGTAAIFKDDPSVFTFSIHNAKNFPSRKIAGDLDIALDDGTGDQEYIEILEETLPKVLNLAKPEIVIYQAGVDGLSTDKWGRFSITHEGMMQRDSLVIAHCRNHNIPIVLVLGGGYSIPIEKTVEAHCNTYRVANKYFT